MADKQSREVVGVDYAKGDYSTVTVRIDVDVADAITGLKAVQREAKEATKALRGVEARSGDVKITLDSERFANELFKPVRADEFSGRRELFEFTTNELADELAKRRTVSEFLTESSFAKISFDNGHSTHVDKCSRILVVEWTDDRE